MVELEVKALVSNVDALKTKIVRLFPGAAQKGSSQLNHYFLYSPEGLRALMNSAGSLGLTTAQQQELLRAGKLSIRTRQDSLQGVRSVFKYSLIDTNAANGNARREIEVPFGGSLDALDAIFLKAGLTYQSKWSRNRTEYHVGEEITICVDLNAGYRGICEVEIANAASHQEALAECRRTLSALGLEELEAGLLEQMFVFYNKHWADFYGTDKSIFEDARFAGAKERQPLG